MRHSRFYISFRTNNLERGRSPMKKALAFLMAAVMLMSMLTACGNKDVADDTKDNNDVNT